MNYIFSIHSLLEWCLLCFQLLAITNKAAKIKKEQVSLECDGVTSMYMTRNDLADSSSRSVSNFLSNNQIDFQSGCTSS